MRPQDTVTHGLFLSKFKRPVTPRGIEWIVNKYFDEAGIQRVSVHSLRHKFGTYMMKRGTNMRVVQEAMGHKDLKTISLYVGLARKQMNKKVQENAL